MTLEAAYLTIVVAGAGLVLLRREPTLIQGRAFLVLTASFASAAAIPWIRAGDPGPSAPFWTILLAISLAARNRWFLSRTDLDAAAAVVERSLKMILVAFEKESFGYRMELPGGAALVQIRRFRPGGVILTFRGDWRQKKAALLRALLVKAFRPIFPRVRIDLR